MLELLTETGFGSCLALGLAIAAIFAAVKKKPEVAAPGQNTTTDKKFVREGV